MKNTKGVVAIISIGLLLLLTIVLFFLFSSWTADLDNKYRIGVEEDSKKLEIVLFKNNSLIVDSSSNSVISTLKVKNQSQQFCDFSNIQLTQGKNNISISSCSLIQGDIYEVLLITSENINKKTMVYR